MEENFKIGLKIEPDVESLESISREVTRAIRDAIDKGTRAGAARRLGAGSPATVKSVKETVEVTGDDFIRDWRRAVAGELAGFETKIDQLSKEISKLSRVIDRSKGTSGALSPEAGVEERRIASRSRGITKLKEELEGPQKHKEFDKQLERETKLKKAINKLQTDNLRDSRKLEDAQDGLVKSIEDEAAAHREAAKKVRSAPVGGGISISGPKQHRQEPLAEKQVGASNIKRAANIEATRAGGSERTAGGGSGPKSSILADAPRVRDGRVGSREDQPTFKRNQEKSMEARERVSGIQKGAEFRVEHINKALSELRSAISKISGFRGMDPSELFAKLNLPGKAEMGTGAAPQVKDFAGQIRVVNGVIELFGDKVSKITTVVNERIKAITAPKGSLEEIERTARRDPEMAISRLRKEIKGIFESSATIAPEGFPRQGFQKGGEFILRYTPTEEEKERLSALRNEAEIIGEVNKALYQYIQNNEELRNTLRKAGIEGIFSTGLQDKKASEIRITRGEKEPGKPAPIEEIEVPVQTRQTATVGLGGEGGLARWAREFLITQMHEIQGGQAPSVKGFMEEQLEEAGMILKSGFKEFVTVLADPDLIPELREDQFLFDPKVVKMAMEEVKSVIVRNVAEGLAPGKKLTKGEVIGTRGEGEEVEQVKADFTGTDATIERLEKVMVDGIEGVRIVYKDLNETISGMKLMERSGIKGIARAADLEKMGFQPGTGIAMSMEGLAKRHGLRTVVEMMSNAISEATGRGAQEIADAIVHALEEGKMSIKDAVKTVAASFGAPNFKGTTAVGGPLAAAAGGNLEVLTGKMAWARSRREGMTGGLEPDLRHIDAAAMTTMRSRAENVAMVEQWSKQIAEATDEHASLIAALRAFTGQLDLASSNLRVIGSEKLKRLPAGSANKADLVGTLLDPELADAFAMSLPAKEGGERMMYVPPIGKGLGERSSFKTQVGTEGPAGLVILLDKIAEQATKIKGLRGELPVVVGSDAMQEASEVTGRAIKSLVADIFELSEAAGKGGKKFTEEGKQKAQEFINTMMPIIESLGTGSVGFKYRMVNEGKPAGREMTVKRSAADYVKFFDEAKTKARSLESQVTAISEILSERGAGKFGENVAQLGKVHDNVEILTAVMRTLNIQLDGTGEAASKAFERLQKLEDLLLSQLAELGYRRAKPESEEKRSIAAAAEGGSSLAPMGVALEFRTDVTRELAKVSQYLNQMAASGQDVGEAAAAFQRISSAQSVDLPAIERDTVLINEKDFRNMAKIFSKKLSISETEATQRLLRPGMAQRYPITGEQSFMPARLRPAPSEIIPEGKLGVSGTMAISSTGDLAKMLAPLEKLEASLIKTAEGANYSGPAAQEAGRQLAELSPVLDRLRMQFLATGLNLDFDGDKIAFHADAMTAAGSDIKTFTDKIDASAVSFQKAFTLALSSVKGPGGPGTSLEDLERMFKMGKAKGRPEEFKAAVSWPGSAERAQFEAAAHTGPKKSVGILSDLFNQTALAINAGSKKLSDAMSTFVGQMLLGINESMASKHGSGGTKGPLEFLESLRKGQLGEIFTAMKAGEGFFGKLAKQNEQMLAHMERDLKRLAATEGAAGLEKFIQTQDLGIKIDPENLAGGIKEIIKSAGIENMITRVFETLKQNLIENLMKGGATLEEAQESIADALAPGKKGFIRGLDLKSLVSAQTPGYAMTRAKSQEDLKELGPEAQARQVLKLIPTDAANDALGSLASACSSAAKCTEDLSKSCSQVSSSLKSVPEEGNLEAEVDVKQIAQSARDALKTWMRDILGGRHGKIQPFSEEDIKHQPQYATAKGAFIQGRETMGGAEGTVKYTTSYIEKTKEALATLGKIIEGNLTNIDTSSLIQLTKDLREFMGTVAHEGVHKANKAWADGINTIKQELMSGSGELGKFSKEIGKVMSAHVGVRKLIEEVLRLEKLKSSGVTREEISTRQEVSPGAFAKVRKVVEIDEAINKARENLINSVAEEMMAYSVQPEKFEVGFMKDLPKAVKDFVKNQVERLKASAGPEGDIMRKTIEAREEITKTILGGLVRAVGGLGPPDVKPEVSKLTAALGEFPDAGRFNRALELLGAHERTIIESGSVFTGMSDIRQKAEGGLERIGEPRTMRLASRPEFENIASKIKEITGEIGEALSDPMRLEHLSKQIQGAAGAARGKITTLRKDPEISRQLGGVTGQEEYVNIVREFQRNVATAFTEKARDLQRQITEMRQLGREQTPEFGVLVNEFVDTITRLQNWASETLAVRGKGRGTIASYAASMRGELLPSAMHAGVAPTKSTFDAIMSSTAGAGKEGEGFLSRMRPSIEGAVTALRDGEEPLKAWNVLFQKMLQHPQTFQQDIVKIVEILKKFSRLIGISNGEFSNLAQSIMKVAGTAGEAAKAVKNLRAPDKAGIVGALVGGTKGQRGAGAMGAGPDFETAINSQYQEMHRQMAERQAKLQKLIKTKGYQTTGEAGTRFEGQTFEIIDPDTGKVMQKFATEFVRHGSNIRSSLKQIGQASKGTGEMLGMAFRRVVQWGFASGVVYGLLRAFRSFGQIITDVQDRMAELQKVMDTSTTDFQMLQDVAVNFAKQFGQPINDVIDGMVVYGQQGLKMAEITERTRATMLAMNTTTLKSTEATEAITSVMKIFSGELRSSEQAVDAWAAVAAKHAIGAAELAIAVQRAGGAAKASGVSFNDLLGITTAIGSVTRQTGKELATGTKFMLRTLRTPTAQKTLLGVGVKSQDIAGNFRPAMEILGEVASRWDDLSTAQKLNTAQAIAGIRHYNQFIVLMENWQEALDGSTNAQNSQGFAARKSAIAMQTFSKQMQVLKATVAEFALGLGKAVLPAATGVVKVLQGMLTVLNYIPDSFKQIGAAGAVLFLSAHKSADLLIDTLEAIGGVGLGLKDKFKAGGLIGAFGALKGKANQVPLAAAGEAIDAAATAQQAETVGILGKALIYVKGAASGVASAFGALTTAGKILTAGTVIGLVAALGSLIYAYASVGKSGKEVEDEMFDQIGVAQDQIANLQSQGKHLQKVSKAWQDYQSAVKTASDPKKLGEAIRSGDFKGPLVAMKEYKDTIYEVGVALATLDPSSVEGISDAGQYIYSASGAMGMLASSAIDAKKATIAAMQTKVITAYADELSKARSGWAKFIEIISFGGIKMDLLSQLEDARSNINELASTMKNDASQGILSSVSAQHEMNSAVKDELALRQETILVAQNIKKVLEELPTFDNTQMARTAINSQAITKSISAAVQGGAFGREASVGGVKMSYMAKNLGLGGLVGSETTASADRFVQELMGKGIMPSKGGAAKEGGVKIISRDLAQQLIEGFVEGAKGKDVTIDVSERARTLLTGIDDLTGEVVYYFEDAINGAAGEIRQSDLSTELQSAITNSLTIDRNQIKEAAEKSERLLTLQATGALAGIRIPKAGMPNIGPATFRELTVDQRVMGALPDEMQRLSDVQSELGEIAKKYNETLDESADVNEHAASSIKENINILDEYQKQLVRNLKVEEFYLSAIAHTESAIQKLNQSLMDYAKAARDANIEEETRADLLKHTSGALAGTAVVSQLDFGKGMRELSGQERLQKMMGPGFSKTLNRFAGVQREYEAGIDQVVDLRKQEADLNEMIRDLDLAGGNLNRELERTITKELTGASDGDQFIAEVIKQQGDAMLNEMQRQTPILDKMLQFMEADAKVAVGGDKQEVFGKLLANLSSDKVAGLLGSGDKKALSQFMSSQVGISPLPVTPGEKTMGRFFGRPAWETSETGLRFESPERKSMFESKRQALLDALENKEVAQAYYSNFKGQSEAKQLEYAEGKVQMATSDLFEMPEVSDAAKKYAEKITASENKVRQQVATEETANRSRDLMQQLMAKRNEALAKFSNAEKMTIAKTEEAARILQTGEAFRLAIATQDFASAIENTITEFQKAEMLFYEKQGSVLEGPFARVGRAGFRTEFEQRRMDLEAPMRPQTYEEMQQRQKDLAAVDFDEKEARIREQQDREVAALRQEQSQAERIREVIADALVGGDLSPDAESTAKSYMDTLTSQLASSEQASMRGGQLFFEGVPALEDARKFLAQIQEQAKEQARKAEAQFQVEIHKKGNQELVGQGVQLIQQGAEQTRILQDIASSCKTMMAGNAPGTTGVGPIPLGTTGLGGGLAPQVSGVPLTWQQQVERAALTPLPNASKGPVTPEDFLTRGAEQDFQAQMQAYANKSSWGAEPIDMSMYKREGRKYGSTLRDYFVKEQTFSSPAEKTPELLPESPDAYMKRVMADYAKRDRFGKSVSRPQDAQGVNVFRPTGTLIPDEVKKGSGPINLTDYYNGASNINQISRMQTRQETGNSKYQTAVVGTSEGAQPGGRADGSIPSRAPAAGASDSQNEALQRIVESIEATNELISNLSSTLQLPADLGSQIENVGTTIVDRLGETIVVEISNAPIAVTVDGLQDAFSSAIDSSGLSSVGASVSDALGRLALLETVVDPQGSSVDELISQATAQLNSTIDQTNVDLNTQIGRIDTLEEQFDAFPDVTSLEANVLSIQGIVDGLEPRVITLEASATDFQTGLNDFGNRLTSIEDTSLQINDSFVSLEQEFVALSTQVSEFGEEVGSFDTRITSAESAVAASTSSVQEISRGLISLQNTVEQNRQISITSFRETNTEIDRAETQIQSIQQTINTLQRKAETALNVAQQAINRANQKT